MRYRERTKDGIALAIYSMIAEKHPALKKYAHNLAIHCSPIGIGLL